MRVTLSFRPQNNDEIEASTSFFGDTSLVSVGRE